MKCPIHGTESEVWDYTDSGMVVYMCKIPGWARHVWYVMSEESVSEEE